MPYLRHLFALQLAMCALLATSMGGARAAEQRIECPAKLEAAALQVVQPPAGWTALVPAGLWLRSAGPMTGPPSEMAILKENAVVTRGGKQIAKWTWDEIGEPPESGGKWMACNYGGGNDVILSRKIDDNSSECTVTYTKNQYGRNELDVRCKSEDVMP
jgi:hypothetical protein